MSAPASFTLEFWALALPPSALEAPKPGAPPQSMVEGARYVRLTDKFQYRFTPNVPCRVVLHTQVATTHLVVRGSYDALSLCLYGNPIAPVHIPSFPLSSPGI
jgi:hypothetical protein